uniref:Uncharacterized protein n=1 Tax=Medicago truncatula TaxID=3880 RepID=Q2HRW0_MEDTR|nr:hypothetical protein MtrDRAFT_AC157890g12v2 [Medicago truncatula]
MALPPSSRSKLQDDVADFTLNQPNKDDKIPITEDCHYRCWGDNGPEGLFGLEEYVQEPYQTPVESVPWAWAGCWEDAPWAWAWAWLRIGRILSKAVLNICRIFSFSAPWAWAWAACEEDPSPISLGRVALGPSS